MGEIVGYVQVFFLFFFIYVRSTPVILNPIEGQVVKISEDYEQVIVPTRHFVSDSGMYINLTIDSSLPPWVEEEQTPDRFVAHVPTKGEAEGIVVSDGIAYLAALDLKNPMLISQRIPSEYWSLIEYDTTNNVEIDPQSNILFVTDNWKGLMLWDIVDIRNPVLVSMYFVGPNGYTDLLLHPDNSDFLLVGADTGGVYCVNVSNKYQPEIVWNEDTTRAEKLFVDGGFLYVADGDAGIIIYNISAISSPPIHVETIPSVGLVLDIFVVDDLIYTAERFSNFFIYNKTNSERISNISIGYKTESVYVVGQYCLISQYSGDEIKVVDVSDPYDPQVVGGISVGSSDTWKISHVVHNMDDNSTFAFITDQHSTNNGWAILNITDILDLEITSKTSTMGIVHTTKLNSNRTILFCASRGGLFEIDIRNRSDPFIPRRFLTLRDVKNFVVEEGHQGGGDYFYIAEGFEGFSIIHVSSEQEGRRTEYLSNEFGDSVVIGVIVREYLYINESSNERSGSRIAYLACQGSGLRIVNITNRGEIVLLSQIDLGSGFCEGMYLDDGLDVLYLACGTDGVFSLNISDPENPQILWNSPHEAPYDESLMIEVSDGYMYVAYSLGGIEIYDVISDPFNPDLVTTVVANYTGSAICVHVKNHLMYVCDKFGGYRVFNVYDSQNPRFIRLWDESVVGEWDYGDDRKAYDLEIFDDGSDGGGESYVVLSEYYFGVTIIRLEQIHLFGRPEWEDCGVSYVDLLVSEEPLLLGNPILESFKMSVVGEWLYEGYCDFFYCDGILGNDTMNVCHGRGECVNPPNTSCDCRDMFWNSSSFCEVCDEGYSNWISWDEDNEDMYNYCITQCNEVWSNETDTVCSRNGLCSYSVIEESGICSCWYNFEGQDCEVCKSGQFFGEDCEVYACNGVLTNDSSNGGVCSGHGECMFHYDYQYFDQYEQQFETSYISFLCECQEHYFGEDCEITTCDGVFSNITFSTDEAVNTTCSGNGNCTYYDNCECSRGYYTQFCSSETICGGIIGSDERVCSENGDCIYEDGMFVCDCNEGYVNSGADSCVLAVYDDNNDDDDDDSSSSLPSYFWSIIVFPSLAVVFFLCCCFCVFGISGFCVCCFIACGFGGISVVPISIYRKRLSKFEKLENVDLILEEQRLNRDQSVAHLNINDNLFEIEFEKLKLLKVIGEGGSDAQVFKCKWNQMICAFKCFKTRAVCTSQLCFDEFERESELLASTSHPHIIQFFGCCLKPPRIGFVMEYCKHGDLSKYLKKRTLKENNPVDLETKLRFLKEIASAMLYLHSVKVIHRDLKLENVLLNEKYTTKLMDFGISRLVEKTQEIKTSGILWEFEKYTITHMFYKSITGIGTCIYMAPEIVTGVTYDEKCDNFSFAIVVYILISENFSPYGISNLGIEWKVAMNPFFRPVIDETKMVFPQFLKNIMEACWDEKPEKRISFEKIVEILEYEGKRLSIDDDGSVSSSEKKRDADECNAESMLRNTNFVFVKSHDQPLHEAEKFILISPTLENVRMIIKNKWKDRRIYDWSELKIFVTRNAAENCDKEKTELKNDEDCAKYLMKENVILEVVFKKGENEEERMKMLENENQRKDEEIEALREEVRRLKKKLSFFEEDSVDTNEESSDDDASSTNEEVEELSDD